MHKLIKNKSAGESVTDYSIYFGDALRIGYIDVVLLFTGLSTMIEISKVSDKLKLDKEVFGCTNLDYVESFWVMAS